MQGKKKKLLLTLSFNSCPLIECNVYGYLRGQMRYTQAEIMRYFPFKLEAHSKRGILLEQELSAPFSSLWDLIMFAVIIQEA